MKIQEVSEKEMSKIIDNRLPLGLFYCWDSEDKVFVGCDNTKGNAYVEEFYVKERCIEWLKNETEMHYYIDEE